MKEKTNLATDLEAKVAELVKDLHDVEDKYRVLCQIHSNCIAESKKTLL